MAILSPFKITPIQILQSLISIIQLRHQMMDFYVITPHHFLLLYCVMAHALSLLERLALVGTPSADKYKPKLVAGEGIEPTT